MLQPRCGWPQLRQERNLCRTHATRISSPVGRHIPLLTELDSFSIADSTRTSPRWGWRSCAHPNGMDSLAPARSAMAGFCLQQIPFAVVALSLPLNRPLGLCCWQILFCEFLTAQVRFINLAVAPKAFGAKGISPWCRQWTSGISRDWRGRWDSRQSDGACRRCRQPNRRGLDRGIATVYSKTVV